MGLVRAPTALPLGCVSVFQGSIGNSTTRCLTADLHLQLLLRVPTLCVFSVGSSLLGRRLD